MFGALTRSEPFLVEVRGLPKEQGEKLGQAVARAIHAERLVFSRWSQVMVRFERGLYEDPDQDLSKLWNDLRAKYQLLPSAGVAGRPDYAAKFHLFTNPVYYHNYLMGELFAAQIRHYVVTNVVKGADPAAALCGHPEVGAYLKERVFGPGNLYPWNELTQKATGERLTAKYFAEESIKDGR
jgi:peptidyl-dipeptidase A